MADESPRYADVLVPVAVDGAYSYAVPRGMAVAEGDIVEVPLGARQTYGCVMALRHEPGGVSHNRLKDIAGKSDAPPLSSALRRLITRVADYTLAPKGMVLKMALRDPASLEPPRPRIGVRANDTRPERMTPARHRLFAVLGDGLARGKSEAAKEAGVSVGVIDALVDEGVLDAVALPPAPLSLPLDALFSPPTLSGQQQEAAAALRQAVAARAYSVTLLDGVTGSGKTEVYCEAIAECLKQGRQALVLLPEIALTAQALERFEKRFGAVPAQWHSGIAERRRALLYQGLAAGEVQLVVGARSALFLPYADLGLIIVDEEHESAYKQADGAHYHARDMAVLRGRIENIPVVLASATPSIETRVNAEAGRYTRLVLPERFGAGEMPNIALIDMTKTPPPKGRWLAPPLERALRETLAAKEQALLFLNRRGYAPLTLCRACGERLQCPNCSAYLVDHRFRKRLICHHCGYTRPTVTECPKCHTEDSMVPCGPGVERLAEECATLFPEARLLILSSDMAGGIARLREEIAAVARGEADIVIGTQLVAKGHNFPHLAMVGVVDADLALGQGDPRAGERTFQVLQQVVGRAGRAKAGSRAFLQTLNPSHPVIQAIAKNDREGFYASEIQMREEARLPPFSRLAAVVVSADDMPAALTHAREMARLAPADPEVSVLGPAEAPLAMVRGRHRVRLLARAPRGHDLSGYMRHWLRALPKAKGGVRVDVDIDPMSFL